MGRLQSGRRIDGFDRFDEALGVVGAGGSDLEAERFEFLKKLPGILTIFRLHFMGHQDAVMLILDHHHTVVRAPGVVAINMTFRRRAAGKQVLKHLFLAGQIGADVINLSLD